VAAQKTSLRGCISKALVWFRRDLRLTDNPAWNSATALHDEVTALFVFDQRLWRSAGPHRGPQLAANVRALDADLARLGGRLLVRHGSPTQVVPREARRVDAVYWNADVSPYSTMRDTRVSASIAAAPFVSWGTLAHPPGAVITEAGAGYKVFTPFYKRWRAISWDPWPAPGQAVIGADPGDGIPETADPIVAPGELGALQRLDDLQEVVDDYHELRDRPDLDATSRLSIDLKFGTISPRLLLGEVGDDGEGRQAFTRQLVWRDFYAHLLLGEPRLTKEEMQPAYRSMKWIEDTEGLEAWKQGRTGYPLVDAGMRQLATEGYMHNRVRMIAASFLVKDLLIDWRYGERHFRQLLLDGDISQNVGNWQWVAGTGADAAPYFRVFNPVTQSLKFDPAGDYIRRWVPELAQVSSPAVHAPWKAGPEALPGLELRRDYPLPIVEHAQARLRALDAYKAARG